MYSDYAFLAVKALLVENGRCYYWVVTMCPWCGQRHLHRGGPITGDPRSYLGYHELRCTGEFEPEKWPAAQALIYRGYLLMDANPDETNKTVEALSQRARRRASSGAQQ